MELPGLSVVLLSWKRPENVDVILRKYVDSEAVSEVLCWCNNPDAPVKFNHPKIRTFNTSMNWGVYVRYTVATLARFSAVLIQDDDLLLPSSTITNLRAQLQGSPRSIHGLFGRRPKSDGTYAEFRDHDNEEVEMVCGRAMMVSRHNAFLFANWLVLGPVELVNSGGDLPYSSVVPFPAGHCDDILFSYYMRSINSGSFHCVYDFPRTELADHDGLHETVKDHWKMRTEAMRWCQRYFGVP